MHQIRVYRRIAAKIVASAGRFDLITSAPISAKIIVASGPAMKLREIDDPYSLQRPWAFEDEAYVQESPLQADQHLHIHGLSPRLVDRIIATRRLGSAWAPIESKSPSIVL